MTGPNDKTRAGWSYRAGVAVTLVTSLLTVWTTIVRDDGNGIGFFLVIMAAGVGAFAAWFRPAGMARAMIGVALMQILWGVATATAPSVASVPGAAANFMVSSAVFALLWLIAAACFRAAARADSGTMTTQPA